MLLLFKRWRTGHDWAKWAAEEDNEEWDDWIAEAEEDCMKLPPGAKDDNFPMDPEAKKRKRQAELLRGFMDAARGLSPEELFSIVAVAAAEQTEPDDHG